MRRLARPVVRLYLRSRSIATAPAVFLLLLASPVHPQTPSNLLANGDFEQVDDHGLPVGWTRFGREAERVVLLSDEGAYGGKRCAYFLPLVSTPQEAPGWAQVLPCRQGQVYRLSAMMKTRGVTGSSAGLRIFWQDQEHNWIWAQAASTGGIVGDNDWLRVKLQGSPPPGAVTLHVLLFGDVGHERAAGETWIDDVVLEEVPADEPYGPFTPDAALQAALDRFATTYDLAVVRAAFHKDAWRAARRWGGRAAPLPTDPAKTWAELGDLREWYHRAYPLIQGQPGNGIRRSRAAYAREYGGDVTRIGEDVAHRTSQAAHLAETLKAELAAVKLPWQAPSPDGSVPGPLMLTPQGEVRRILFGGSHELPSLSRFGRAHRLMDYDYQLQVYEALEWPERDKPRFHDEKVVDPYRPLGLGVDLILSYSNHGFEYCPEWLWAIIAGDVTAWATPDRWEAEKTSYQRLPRLNIAHPQVREALLSYLREIGRHYRDSRNIAFYRGPWEPTFSPWEAKGEAGRDPVCLGLFRQRLEQRYGTITRLNQAWGTSYASFAAIEPPPSAKGGGVKETSPLWYEFQRFRCDLFMDWWAECYRALKQADPNHLIAIDTCVGFLGGGLGPSVDWWRAAKESADILSHHDGRAGSEADYLVYSYGRYHPEKALGQLEYVWNGPECWSDPPDEVVYAAGERNLWRGAALNLRIYGMYGHNDTYVGMPSRTQSSFNNLSDFETDYTLFRPCAGVIPLLHRKLNALPQAFIESRIREPQVALLQPSESLIAVLPEGTVEGAVGEAHAWLYDERVHHAFVPEEAVAEGVEKLDAFRAIILPQAHVLPAAVQARLQDWVRKGGLLIAVGPFAIHDRYGRPDGAWMGRLFPSADQADVRRATDGKGEVILLAGQEALRRPPVRGELTAAMARVAPPLVRSDGNRIGWVVRELRGTTYLVCFNRDPRSAAEETLSLPASVKQVRDLTAPGQPQAPLERGGGATQVRLKLEAGEGTVLAMD